MSGAPRPFSVKYGAAHSRVKKLCVCGRERARANIDETTVRLVHVPRRTGHEGAILVITRANSIGIGR